MEVTSLGVFVILFYFILVVTIGYLASKKKSEDSFLIANRNLGSVHLAATLNAGFIGGGFLVIFIGIAYTYGIPALWLIFGQSLGLVLFAIFGKSIKETSDKNRFYTLADYFNNKFDKKTGVLIGLMLFLFFMGFIIIQFVAGGKILSGLIGLSYQLSVLVIGLIIMIYLYLGGFRAVVRTDLLQYLMLFFFMGVIGFFVLSSNISPADASFSSIEIPTIIAFIIFGMFFVIIGGDVWQRAYAAKSLKVMRKGFSLAALLTIIFGLLAVFIGIAAKINFPSIDPAQALVKGFSFLLPPELLWIGIIILFAAIMSTSDTLIFLASMNLSNDIFSRFKNISKKSLVKLTRSSIFFVTITGVTLALLIPDIVNFAFIFTAAMITLAPIIITMQFKEIKSNSVFYTLLITPSVILAIAILTPIREELSLVSLVVASTILFASEKIKIKAAY